MALNTLIRSLIDYNAPHWTSNDIVFFTANQVVKANGHLVMGAGNAKAARDAVQGSALAFGQSLGEKRVHVIRFQGIWLGALVTKQHFKDPSDLEFVIKSLRELFKMAKRNPTKTFHVPYPAIGNGGLKRNQLDKYISQLPTNIKVYINPKSRG